MLSFLIIFFTAFFAFLCLNNVYWVIISVNFIVLQWASKKMIKIPHWRLLFAMRAIKKEYLSRDFIFRTYNKHLAISRLSGHLQQLGILFRKTLTRTLRHVLINVFFLQSVKLYQFVNFWQPFFFFQHSVNVMV